MTGSHTTKAGGYPANINNPDDWAAFLARYLDNRATNAVHNGIGLVALHIVDAIKDARAAALPRPSLWRCLLNAFRKYPL